MIDLAYEKLINDFFNEQETGKTIHHCCVICGVENNDRTINRCPICGGVMDAIYNLSGAKTVASINPLERYFSFLPILNRENLIWLGEGNTPCFHAHNLGKVIGLSNLFVKDETSNPTRSTKDRIASVGLSQFKELGIKHFVIASTGNSSTAYARGVQIAGEFKVDIFVAKDFLQRLNYYDHPNVRTYVCSSDFVGAGTHAKQHANQEKLFFEGGFFSLARREALKLSYLEAFDKMPEEPGYIFQAVSSGMGLLGAYKGVLEYKKLGYLLKTPKFIAVQQASCSPMVHAYNEKSDNIKSQHIIKNPKGLAEAILRGDPTQSYPYIYSLCNKTKGQILAATDKEIYLAHKLLLELEGLNSCYAGATALAGAIKMRQELCLPEDAIVLVNITGANRAFSPVPKRIIYV